MESGLRDRVVLVTGASGGIGSAIARKFAQEGARLALHYRTGGERIRKVQSEIGGTESLLIRADLANEAEVKRAMAQTIKRFGRIDTLVANAGSWETREVPLHQMKISQWQQTMKGVLTTTFFSTREFLRLVGRQKQGNLVLIASTAGIFGEAGHADYAAAKAAVAYGLTRSLKNEIGRLAPHTRDYCGGRVNCVCPGWTVVPRLASRLKNAKVIRRVTATMALPQLARPEDIADSVVFLSSDRLARHITGQVVVVAGGMEGRQLWEANQVDTRLV